MKTSIFFIARITFAWTLAFVLALIVWLAFMGKERGGPSWPFVLAALLTIGWQITCAFSHLRRVRLIAGHVDAGTVANRQRRQIELAHDQGTRGGDGAAAREGSRTDAVCP